MEKKDNIKKKLIVLHVIFGLSVGLMVFFATSLALEMHSNRQGQEFYADLTIDFMPRQIAIDDSRRHDAIDPTVADEEIAYDTEEPKPFIDFNAMRENFPDIVGWIQSEGTNINYPIVQAHDNYFYLGRLPDQSRHSWGSIFLDYRNAADFSDFNILIYGHNMRSGDMFGSLKDYRRPNYYEQYSSMYIFTPEQNFVLMIFAGYDLDSAFEVPPMYFSDEEHFENFIADIRNRSVFRSDTEVNFGDTLVFLCTCTESDSINERLIIVGKLLEI